MRTATAPPCSFRTITNGGPSDRKIQMKKTILIITAAIASVNAYCRHLPENIFSGSLVSVSSFADGYIGQKAVDGKTSRKDSWMTAADARPPHNISLTLGKYADIDSVVIISGIPEHEKSESEKGQAPGFWSVKNLKLQYWDDANWTDIPGTEITENRNGRIAFRFERKVRTYRIRMVSADGEQIRINEIYGFGKILDNMPSPETAKANDSGTEGTPLTEMDITVRPDTTGTSMQFVGYNQGYYMPGSNISDWMEWSEANSMRLWTDLGSYSKKEWLQETEGISGLDDFERHKSRLRANPESGEYINIDSVAANAMKPVYSTNSMSLDYALKELKRIGVAPLLQINNRNFGSSWEEKFTVWRRYYALAFYAAKTGDATMFAIHNEPNHRHAGPMKTGDYIAGMRLVSDAVHCALEDVNRLYGKSLEAKFVGPVTAGTNTDWWAKVSAAEGTDYMGRHTDRELIDIFSTHSYNSPAAGYRNKVNSIREIITENHPLGKSKPIVFTETGRWMNAYLIDKEETMDSPTLFTEWAGMYTNNMLNGCYGMWAFKMANTTSSTYPRGIKSGHHHIWKGRRIIEDALDNLAFGMPVSASDGSTPAELTDGSKEDSSSWTCDGDGEKWVEIDLGQEKELCGAIIYTGSSYGEFTGPDRVRKSRLEALTGGKWETIPETVEENCKYVQCIYTFRDPVKAERIRYVAGDEGKVTIREIKLFGKDILDAEESYDIGGAMRTAHVVRLFARGFRGSRPLLDCRKSVENDDFDAVASIGGDGTVNVWIVQRNNTACRTVLDMSALGLEEGDPAVIETVSGTRYGEASIIRTSEDGKLSFTAEPLSVNLISVPSVHKTKTIRAVLAEGTGKASAEGRPAIRMNASTPDSNSAVILQFRVPEKETSEASRILLDISGWCTGNDIYRFHTYMWSGEGKIRDIAAECGRYADMEDSRAFSEMEELHFTGEMTVNPEEQRHMIDVTSIVSRHHAGEYLNFMLIREPRQPGDDADKHREAAISAGKESGPVLHLITNM